METLSPVRARWLIRVAVALVGAAGLLMLGFTLAGGNLTDALDDLVTILLAVGVVAALAGWAHERRSDAARAALEEQRRGSMDERARELEDAARASDARSEHLERRLREQREAASRAAASGADRKSPSGRAGVGARAARAGAAHVSQQRIVR